MAPELRDRIARCFAGVASDQRCGPMRFLGHRIHSPFIFAANPVAAATAAAGAAAAAAAVAAAAAAGAAAAAAATAGAATPAAVVAAPARSQAYVASIVRVGSPRCHQVACRPALRIGQLLLLLLLLLRLLLVRPGSVAVGYLFLSAASSAL